MSHKCDLTSPSGWFFWVRFPSPSVHFEKFKSQPTF
uniref:Uncharacterized protein n=1 Tax=Rhizophora mucronata TaxID=61149 RepID=A0A2P2NBR7_RHIMU